MTNKFPEHTAANYLLHTGHNPAGRPSVGAWCAYGLGSESKNLPGYVVVDGGLTPPGGIECYGSGFLSPSYQGSTFRSKGEPVAHARGPHSGSEREANRRRLLEALISAAVSATAPSRPPSTTTSSPSGCSPPFPSSRT